MRADGAKDINMQAETFGQGHVPDAPTKLTVPYDTAKSMLIEGHQQAAMQAFMSGQIKIEGDMSNLIQNRRVAGPGGLPELPA